MREMVIVFPVSTQAQQEAKKRFRAFLLRSGEGFRTRRATGFWRDPKSGKEYMEACLEFVIATNWPTTVLMVATEALKDAGERAMYWVDTSGDVHIDNLKKEAA